MRNYPMRKISLHMSPEELEALVRRVVREEISRVLRRPPSILEDRRQEGLAIQEKTRNYCKKP